MMQEPIPSIELALIRWSVVRQRWSELAGGNMPLLTAFLAGWCCRSIGAAYPETTGQFKDSFHAGWTEANSQMILLQREREDRQQLEQRLANLETAANALKTVREKLAGDASYKEKGEAFVELLKATDRVCQLVSSSPVLGTEYKEGE